MPTPPAPPALLIDPAPEALASLDAQCFPDAWAAPDYARLRANPAVHAWLLAQDGAPCALLVAQVVDDEAELYRIAVQPDRRRAGLGAWLLGRFLAGAPEFATAGGGAAPRRVHLEVRADNAAARRLYEQAGFRETGRRPGYYRGSSGTAVDAAVDDAVDAVVYAWERTDSTA